MKEKVEEFLAEAEKFSCQQHGRKTHKGCIACEVTEDIMNLAEIVEFLYPYYIAVDTAVVTVHLGTAESFETPNHAVNALASYYQDLGIFFEKEKVEKMTKALQDIVFATKPEPRDGSYHENAFTIAKNVLEECHGPVDKKESST